MLKVYTNQGIVPLTIIGKDLSAYGTFNADLNPNAGYQKAGRFMSYDDTTKQLTPWDGTADAGGATIYGILADDVDIRDNNTTVSAAVMVYRGGTFLRQEIESANNASINPNSALDKALRDLGFLLELSYETYLGLNPVPTGAEPMPGDLALEEDTTQAQGGSAGNPSQTTGPTTEPPATTNPTA